MRCCWSMSIVVSLGIALGCGSPSSDPEWTAIDIGPKTSLSGVWGSSSDDVFIVGGTSSDGEIHHFDGNAWSAMEVPADVGLLSWSFGFSSNDVWSVGLRGAVVHYDGTSWTEVSSNTDEDLWGVWGSSPNDIYIVGGNVFSGEVTILHWNGSEFEAEELPDEANPLRVRALFKVFGVGGRVFAVGQNGLIVERTSEGWTRHSAGSGATEDFVSLWGTSANNIVAVGGRTRPKISTWDGTSWTTFEASKNFGGLNAVYVSPLGEILVGGAQGTVGELDRDAQDVVFRDSDTTIDVHAIWVDPNGLAYAVGGTFFDPDQGVVMTLEAE